MRPLAKTAICVAAVYGLYSLTAYLHRPAQTTWHSCRDIGQDVTTIYATRKVSVTHHYACADGTPSVEQDLESVQ